MWQQLTPLMLANTIVPSTLLVSILLIRTAGGRWGAAAFNIGMVAISLVEGALFAYVLPAPQQNSSGGSPIIATLMVVLGAVMLAAAVRSLVNRDDEPDTPPAWLKKIASINAFEAFALGFVARGLAPKVVVLTGAAVGIIAHANIGQAASIGTYLIFTVVSIIPNLAILAVSIIFRRQADSILNSMQTWIETHSRALAVGIGIVFGIWFIVSGLRAGA